MRYLKLELIHNAIEVKHHITQIFTRAFAFAQSQCTQKPSQILTVRLNPRVEIKYKPFIIICIFSCGFRFV